MQFRLWLENFGTRIVVDDSTFDGKRDPTQYSKEDNIIYVKSSYDIKNDPAGWIVHEYKHAELKDIDDDPENYPENKVEVEAYKAQFDYLKRKGYKNFDDIFKIPTLEHKKEFYDILKKYWFNQ